MNDADTARRIFAQAFATPALKASFSESESRLIVEQITGKSPMKAPTEQQLSDPAWWSEYAPEDATHYDIGDGAPNAWMKKEGDYWYAWTISGKWSEYAADVIEVQTDFIPRPAKPSASGLNGEMPDDGELVVVADEIANPGVYFLCEFQSDGPRFQEHPKGGCFYPDEISGWTGTGIVVRTQADREREQAIDNALARCGYDPSEFKGSQRPERAQHGVFDAINDLYDAGMLRKGAGDER